MPPPPCGPPLHRLLPALLLFLLAATPRRCRAACVNRYDHGENSCAAMLAAGFTCDGDFCRADDTPDETDGAAVPTAACVYAGYCDLSCQFCSEDAPPPPPLSSDDCLDAVPLELRGEYSNCTAMVAARGCDGQVRRDAQMEYSRAEHEYRPTSEQISVKVWSLCRRSCRSCCTDSWAVESGQPGFCSMQIASGEYSCDAHFCRDSSCAQPYPEFAGKCDATCHFCLAESRRERVYGRRTALWPPAVGIVDEAVRVVCTSCMLSTVRRLSALRSRYAMGSSGEAEASIALLETLVAETAAPGTVTTVRQRFTGLDPRLPLANLIVRMSGVGGGGDDAGGGSGPVNTSESIIIGAHFDCTNHRPGAVADESKPAPGADDNGSGEALGTSIAWPHTHTLTHSLTHSLDTSTCGCRCGSSSGDNASAFQHGRGRRVASKAEHPIHLLRCRGAGLHRITPLRPQLPRRSRLHAASPSAPSGLWAT